MTKVKHLLLWDTFIYQMRNISSNKVESMTHYLKIRYYVNCLGPLGVNRFQLRKRFGAYGNLQNQNPGATSYTTLLIQPIWPIIEVIGLD